MLGLPALAAALRGAAADAYLIRDHAPIPNAIFLHSHQKKLSPTAPRRMTPRGDCAKDDIRGGIPSSMTQTSACRTDALCSDPSCRFGTLIVMASKPQTLVGVWRCTVACTAAPECRAALACVIRGPSQCPVELLLPGLLLSEGSPHNLSICVSCSQVKLSLQELCHGASALTS